MSKTDRNEIEELFTGEVFEPEPDESIEDASLRWCNKCGWQPCDCFKAPVTFVAAQARLARVLNRMADRLKPHLEEKNGR